MAALRRHAQTVRETAGAIEQAHAAAQTVVLGNGAFGILCQALPMMFGGLAESVSDAIGRAGAHYGEQAEGLVATADAYDRADDRSSETVQRVGSGLAGGAGAGA